MNAVPVTFGQELDGWSTQRRLGWRAAVAVIGHHALQGQQVFRVGAGTE
jgi:fumarate hydratase class II